jgi:tetratricopeptide (TPR) repeat protein
MSLFRYASTHTPAERYLYLPSVGICLLGATAIVRLPRALARWLPAVPPRVARALAAVVAVAALAALGAKTLARNEAWRDTVSLWRAEVALAPRDPVANNNLAVELMGHGDSASAKTVAMTAIEADPGFWLAHMNLGTAERNLGDEAAAAREFEAAIRIAPEAAEPALRLGLLRLDQGRLEEARLLFEAIVARSPEYAPGLLRAGQVRYLTGRPRLAEPALRRAIELDPAAELPHAYLGLVALRDGDRARADAEAAHLSFPLEGAAFEAGHYLALAGRRREAIAQFELALALNPSHSRALFQIGRLDEDLGERAAAIESYRRALAISPTYADASEALARLTK